MMSLNLPKVSLKNDNILLFNNNNALPAQFLLKKRFKSDDNIKETDAKAKEDNFLSFFSFNQKIKLEIFLNTFTQIIKNKKLCGDEKLVKEKKAYFNSSFNLKFINLINNYYARNKSYLKLAHLISSKELINLIRTFLINETEFSILTLLIEEFIKCFKNILEKENIYYLGLYTKYISSETYSEVFHIMLNTNIFFKNWYLTYNLFLQSRDLSFPNINKRSNIFNFKEPKIEMVNYNLMIDEILYSKKEKEPDVSQEKKEEKTNSNIGKKMNVVIVYQEETSQNISSNNDIDKNDSSNNDIEGLQTDLSI